MATSTREPLAEPAPLAHDTPVCGRAQRARAGHHRCARLVVRHAPAQRPRTPLSQEKVKSSPSIDRAKPVSRQYETSFYHYYGYPYYWGGPYRWGPTPVPFMAIPLGPPSTAAEEVAARERESQDPLRPPLDAAISAMSRTTSSTRPRGRSATSWSIRAAGGAAPTRSSRPSGSEASTGTTASWR